MINWGDRKAVDKRFVDAQNATPSLAGIKMYFATAQGNKNAIPPTIQPSKFPHPSPCPHPAPTPTPLPDSIPNRSYILGPAPQPPISCHTHTHTRTPHPHKHPCPPPSPQHHSLHRFPDFIHGPSLQMSRRNMKKTTSCLAAWTAPSKPGWARARGARGRSPAGKQGREPLKEGVLEGGTSPRIMRSVSLGRSMWHRSHRSHRSYRRALQGDVQALCYRLVVCSSATGPFKNTTGCFPRNLLRSPPRSPSERNVWDAHSLRRQAVRCTLGAQTHNTIPLAT